MIELQRLYWRLICNDQHPYYSMMLALSALYDDDDDEMLVVVSLIEMDDELAFDRWRTSYDDEDSN